MTAVVTAGAGFLLAVLWFDLMFDVQARRAPVTSEALASISAYYRRVTIQAFPMNRLVALVMLATIGSLIVEVADDDVPRWASAVSLGLTLCACGLALGRTFRNGARLGSGRRAADEQALLARKMLADHLACLAAIVTVLTLQLGWGQT
jgi:hypothetical protein